jgi:demethylmenaquinone methyltransferase/2-methoxy-6-polyprenyl-1,4-benzoquinol methylase
MIEAAAPTAPIRRAYDFYSRVYGTLAAPLERRPRMEALAALDVRPQDRVLEVAVGPGATLLEILKRVDRGTVVHGVDLSPKMLARSRRLAEAAGYTNIDLREADARRLPFPDESFDVLYNSFMLDLMPLSDMPLVLAEFRRVLRPAGRLALVNLSKRDGGSRSWYERLYASLPRHWVPYVLGGCRPVLMEQLVRQASFCDVSREFVRHVVPSEIVLARKTAAESPTRPPGQVGRADRSTQ